MDDWVFCNKCSLKYKINIKFYLSECGHIFCDNCMAKIKQTKKCAVCNNVTASIELSKDMDHTKQIYFWPMTNIIQQNLRIFEFQTMHKNLFLQTLTKKYSFVKRECITYHNANKKLQKEIELLRDVLKKLGYKTNPFISSTPSRDANYACDNDLTGISSIRFTTPGSYPGSAKRTFHHENSRNPMVPSVTSVSSSSHDPSPLQTVPRGFIASVHRNPAAFTPNFMSKLRSKSGNVQMAYPRR